MTDGAIISSCIGRRMYIHFPIPQNQKIYILKFLVCACLSKKRTGFQGVKHIFELKFITTTGNLLLRKQKKKYQSIWFLQTIFFLLKPFTDIESVQDFARHKQTPNNIFKTNSVKRILTLKVMFKTFLVI